MEQGINNNVNLINDVSGFKYDNNSINIVKKIKLLSLFIICRVTQKYAKKSKI